MNKGASLFAGLSLLVLGCGEKLDPVKANYDYSQDLPAGLLPADVCYETRVSQIVGNSCFPCHQAGGEGSGKALLDSYAGLKSNIDEALAQVESGNMPKRGQLLTREEIAILGVWRDNGFKTCQASGVVELESWVVERLPDTLGACFSRDVLPILQSRCFNCHFSGGVAPTAYQKGYNWNSFDTVRIWITAIINDVANGIMPRGGPALDSTELAILKYWKFSGTKECN